MVIFTRENNGDVPLMATSYYRCLFGMQWGRRVLE
jgi:hypothetical protein